MTVAQRQPGGVVAVDVVAGGAGYTAPPAVTFSGGGGTGAAAVAAVAAGQLQEIVITNAGTGYTSSPTVSVVGSGTAKAYVYAGPPRPMNFFQGRSGEVYGVDGMGRGIRLDCGATAAVPIGLAPPSSGPAITASSTTAGRYVASIHLTRVGAGYTETPVVTISGGSPTKAAEGRAAMRDGAVRAVAVQEPGSGYVSQPEVVLSGGFHAGAALAVNVSGGVENVRVLNGGTQYEITTASPMGVTFSSAQGLTNAYALPEIDEVGRVSGVRLLASGTGATTTGVTAVVFGGKGSNAVLAVDMRYSVTSVTVTNGGTDHVVPPVLTFRPAVADVGGGGGQAEAVVSGGVVTGVTVTAGGSYALPPSVVINDTTAEAVAVLAPSIQGDYLCCVRFLDKDGTPSSISHLTEVSVPNGTNTLLWTLSFANMDARVDKIELWRTSADQSVVLYRVATVAKATPTYSDTMTEPELLNPERDGYGLMPITLPSGQINARRFGVPPGNYAYAAMFQDRLWLAGDTTGQRPNSLVFSEVDEPESVPLDNELVLQENAGEHDTIVGLVPLGGELLVVQTGHLYSLRYVAQPIIDASLTLVAYRGALNNACCAVMGGVAFLVDSYGLYAFDGRQERALSAAVDNYWRDGLIDFSKAHLCHVSSDFESRTVRFHYCEATDSQPVRALCFCLATEAWWTEQYPTPVTASVSALVGGKRVDLFGTAGTFRRFAPGPDAEGNVEWRYRSGNMTLVEGPSRSVGVLYQPTATTCPLSLSLHLNGSTAARSFPVATDRGTGFTNTAAATEMVLDMAASRSPLGPATGYAEAMFAGRLDPRSAGADRHVAVAFAGTRGPDAVVIHGVTVEGAT